MNPLRSFFQFIHSAVRGKARICTIINYCTNDYPFIGHCIREAAAVSDEVIVPYTDHFYDGTPENQELISRTIQENPAARFVFFPYDAKLDVRPQHWVTYARLVGWKNSGPDTDFILFLDSDEVVDYKRFIRWKSAFPLAKMNVVKLANYYYFRETKYQATTFEDSAIIARKSLLTEALIMDFLDRDKSYRELPEPKARMVLGVDGQPLIHHYSWVRSQEEMVKKVSTWGHSHERPWVELVRKEFEHEFDGNDFVHGYQYKTVEPFITPTNPTT